MWTANQSRSNCGFAPEVRCWEHLRQQAQEEEAAGLQPPRVTLGEACRERLLRPHETGARSGGGEERDVVSKLLRSGKEMDERKRLTHAAHLRPQQIRRP